MILAPMITARRNPCFYRRDVLLLRSEKYPPLMLEFCKDILLRVSFSRKLFKKELVKSVRWLNKREQVMLRAWCIATFGSLYGDVIVEAFQHVPLERL